VGRISWPPTGSAAYVSNVAYALGADDYFASETDPFLHTWSLGVEEQLSLAWHLVFLGAAVLATRRGIAPGVCSVWSWR
jgi:peptidoglycan/LPS O-acetylase OafA/YrhL